MDMQKFNAGLERLLTECGAELAENPEIQVGKTAPERFIGSGLEVDCYQAVRDRQSLSIRITVKADQVSNWRHESGDDRRLHPDLKAPEA